MKMMFILTSTKCGKATLGKKARQNFFLLMVREWLREADSENTG
jgi:hypothetical protein